VGAMSSGAKETARPLRVLVAGGGTGGHVYPGLAVAEAVQAAAPRAEIRFAGTRRGLEAILVPQAGYRLHTVPASGFRGLGPLARLRFLLNFAAGLVSSLWLLARWRPDVVLGTGGYASAPIMAAARLRSIPCALQEQNTIPGSANRLLARWADRIYLGFAESQQYFPEKSCLFTGNPVRASFSRGQKPSTAEKEVSPCLSANANDDGLRLLIFGGSRGARTLNNAAKGATALWQRQPCPAIWLQTGPAQKEELVAAYAEFPQDRVRVTAYIFDMPTALAWADLAVCRAGAMTLAELHVLGKPAVLVPFPHATDDHQLKNARACEEAGAAVVVTNDALTPQVLVDTVESLAEDSARLQAMGQAAAALARPEAATKIAQDLLRLTLGEDAVLPGEYKDVP